MKRAKRYYVIFEDSQMFPSGEWKVKLENGRVVSTHGPNRGDAIDRAQQLGYNNDRPVMVNYKDGRTGAVYYSVEELQSKFGTNQKGFY